MTAMPKDERVTEAEYFEFLASSEFRCEYVDGYIVAQWSDGSKEHIVNH